MYGSTNRPESLEDCIEEDSAFDKRHNEEDRHEFYIQPVRWAAFPPLPRYGWFNNHNLAEHSLALFDVLDQSGDLGPKFDLFECIASLHNLPHGHARNLLTSYKSIRSVELTMVGTPSTDFAMPFAPKAFSISLMTIEYALEESQRHLITFGEFDDLPETKPLLLYGYGRPITREDLP